LLLLTNLFFFKPSYPPPITRVGKHPILGPQLTSVDNWISDSYGREINKFESNAKKKNDKKHSNPEGVPEIEMADLDHQVMQSDENLEQELAACNSSRETSRKKTYISSNDKSFPLQDQMTVSSQLPVDVPLSLRDMAFSLRYKFTKQGMTQGIVWKKIEIVCN
jgi:hypothetical protein